MPRSALSQAIENTSTVAATRQFSIPAQPLTDALGQFGRQSGLQVAFPAEVAQGLSANAVVGTFTPRDALARLLQGTGVSWRITAQGAVIVGGQTTDASDDGAVTADGSLLLDTITVTGQSERAASSGSGYQGTPDWVYETPSSVSVVSREAIQNSGARNTRDLFNNISGVYAGEANGSFPTVSPNIRGLQDAGRVVVSIDGARQNAQRGMSFGGTGGGYQSNAGQAFVDSAFIRTVEVEKTTDATSGNAGSLGGSVDFRTIGAEDLIKEGRNWGAELNATTGTNAYDFQGSVLGAFRFPDTPLSVTAGYSRSSLGEYEIGRHGSSDTTEENMKNQLGRDGWSSLLKVEGDFGDLQASLSWMHQENEFLYGSSGGTSRNFEDSRNDSVSARFSWDPASDLVDLQGSLWLNDSAMMEMREARPSGAPDTYIDTGLKSFGGSLENTSLFDTAVGALSFNYGMEAFRDIASASATSATIASNPTWASNYTAFSPPGRRDVAGLFLNGELEPADWVTLRTGMRYDWSRLKGTATYYQQVAASTYTAGSQISRYDYALAYDPDSLVGLPPFLVNILKSQYGEVYNGVFYQAGSQIPELSTPAGYSGTTLDIDRTDSAWLPSASVEFKPADWFRPYVSYSHSFRPPTILEAFFAGGTPSDGSPGTIFAPNEWLKPEKARTAELGTNILFDNVLHDGDSVRLKASAFYREVDDYIVLGSILTRDVANKTYYGFVNYDGTTYMRGIELEGNYNTERYWLGGSLTFLDTKWPSKTQVFSNGAITTDGEVFATSGAVAPELKATIDAGVRFFDGRLSVGGRLTHVTPTQSRTLDDDGNLREVSDPYTVADIYASYALTDSAVLKVAVNNVMDRNYIPATSSYTAPGRTFLATLNMKF
ncbi:TonB-dependent receptor [uncultured Pleomorphomonas sp.]|uniref:TonB-dependent receptor n=1 Tax=uncultured Pleomorphomonas sp. TaxID=442121 RepID=UPI002588F78F|nr:TonB-dependent receptor [uncultured Pleomorphomonas sp.]